MVGLAKQEQEQTKAVKLTTFQLQFIHRMNLYNDPAINEYSRKYFKLSFKLVPAHAQQL